MTISDSLTVVHVPASIVVIIIINIVIITSSILCPPIQCQGSSSLTPLKQEYQRYHRPQHPPLIISTQSPRS